MIYEANNVYYKSDNHIYNLYIYILQGKVSEGNFSSCIRVPIRSRDPIALVIIDFVMLIIFCSL